MNTTASAQHDSASPFHAGEHLVQARLGVREIIEPWARKVVAPELNQQHQDFYTQLPFLVIAARDRHGRPWASLLAGAPGFVSAADPSRLSIDALPGPGDALAAGLSDGDDIGILGIELHSRRRNRVNGRVAARGARGFELGVSQAFGNCPQYIHARRWRPVPGNRTPPPARRQQRLSSALHEFIERADTFFIASGHRGEGESPAFGMDASHRGGAPGFVRIIDPTTLVFPDYAGNNHFNTLGNLSLDPRAGLLFVDFDSGGLLQLSGRTRIDWDEPDQQHYPGARRLVYFQLDAAIERPGALPLRFESPASAVRELRLIEKIKESDDVSSFVFASRDGAPLAPFSAGQHLPIEVAIPGHDTAFSRSYSLSGPPGNAEHYRITVKREPRGLVSGYLHDQAAVGQIFSAWLPQGDFVVEHEGSSPIVLVSAGVGLTPMLSMLHALADQSAGRPVWFVHGARDGRHHPLKEEVRRLASVSPEIHTHIAYSRSRATDHEGIDYHSRGRIDAGLLRTLVPDSDADYYLCGPLSFMTDLQQQLEDSGVPAKRIRTETFGPSG